MTMHASKGLEFDTVYLIHTNEGCIPYKRALEENGLEEERRLFYVGMTRAKNELYVFSFQNGENSPFITELFSKKKEIGNPMTGLKAGMTIFHLKFGRGIVKKCEGNIARVEFADGSVRNLAIPVVLSNHMIRVEKK